MNFKLVEKTTPKKRLILEQKYIDKRLSEGYLLYNSAHPNANHSISYMTAVIEDNFVQHQLKHVQLKHIMDISLNIYKYLDLIYDVDLKDVFEIVNKSILED